MILGVDGLGRWIHGTVLYKAVIVARADPDGVV